MLKFILDLITLSTSFDWFLFHTSIYLIDSFCFLTWIIGKVKTKAAYEYPKRP